MRLAGLTVPGNLLFFGEYAVLEEGGLGIAAAIERRVVIEVVPAPELSILGRSGRARVEWTPRRAVQGAASQGQERAVGESSGDLLGAVVQACDRSLARPEGREADYPLRLTVDSTALFDPNGAKSGFGSSAAVAVGVTAALLRWDPAEELPSDALLFETALAAHRAFQDGRGSGYDIAASLEGGLLLFTGGLRPSFRRVSLPWLPPFCLVHTEHPVKTPGAITRYLAWKRRRPQEADRFLHRSNEAIRAILAAATWEEALPIMVEATRLGIWLGREIEVPAELGAAGGLPGQPLGAASLLKAVGAGDELGVLWAPRGQRLPQLPEPVAPAGIVWSV